MNTTPFKNKSLEIFKRIPLRMSILCEPTNQTLKFKTKGRRAHAAIIFVFIFDYARNLYIFWVFEWPCLCDTRKFSRGW